GIVVAAVVVGGTVLVMNQNGTNDKVDTSQQISSKKMLESKINDPQGEYKLFSDQSITKVPTKDEVIGGGKAISIEYDGSKSKEDSSLFYTLYYVDKEGDVRQVTGSSFTGINKGTFTTSDKVFDSNANGRPGFLKVYIIKSAAIDPAAGGSSALNSTPIGLGMYAVTIKSD
ncbi:hypothetical protein H0W80_03525, partial [Candidatus Saccharibacteria bacterium]|nr:hypothetical protein [Candidatus Saccharibacteria bacterium]